VEGQPWGRGRLRAGGRRRTEAGGAAQQEAQRSTATGAAPGPGACGARSAESEKHCDCCGKDLRLIAEETSQRYEFVPAVRKGIEDVRLKYACDCTVKTADKPAQPIEKSTAGASLLAQVIVSKFADHLPLHRQEKICERHGVEISRKTMGGWLPTVAELLDPLYQAAKEKCCFSPR
jgi:transposase